MNTSALLTGLVLQTGVQYQIRVKAVNKAGLERIAASPSFEVDFVPPDADNAFVTKGPFPDIDIGSFVVPSQITIRWGDFQFASDNPNAFYLWSVGSGHEFDDVYPLTFSSETSQVLAINPTTHTIEPIFGIQTSRTGLELHEGQNYSVTVFAYSVAGTFSHKQSGEFFVSWAQPTGGIVWDGAVSGDVDFQSSLSTVHASWFGFEPNGQLSHYEWGMGLCSSGSNLDVFGYVSAGLNNSASFTVAEPLQPGVAYCARVMAVEDVTSTAGPLVVSSDGIIACPVPPSAVGVVVSDGPATGFDIDFQPFRGCQISDSACRCCS
jgi:hypothetical protein